MAFYLCLFLPPFLVSLELYLLDGWQTNELFVSDYSRLAGPYNNPWKKGNRLSHGSGILHCDYGHYDRPTLVDIYTYLPTQIFLFCQNSSLCVNSVLKQFSIHFYWLNITAQNDNGTFLDDRSEKRTDQFADYKELFYFASHICSNNNDAVNCNP